MIAVIIRKGIERMYEQQESLFYYISVGNENYSMPAMPEGVKEGIIKGLYRFSQSAKSSGLKAHLLGSGAIMNPGFRGPKDPGRKIQCFHRCVVSHQLQ